MSLWDGVKLLSAADAAYLAIPKDEPELKALLTRMRDSYERAVAEVVSKRFELSHPNALGNKKFVRYYSLDDPLPEGLLYSRALAMHVTRIFQPNPSEISIQSFYDWCKNLSGKTSTSSCKFEIQKFDRDELKRWFDFHQIVSAYDFVRINDPPPEDSSGTEPLDVSTLANPDRLLEAFSRHGLHKAWFDSPKSHSWLLNARKKIGVGGNRSKPPLYCPYEVMLGVTTQIRRGSDAPPRLSEETGWSVLKHHFPEAFEKFKHLKSDDDQRF